MKHRTFGDRLKYSLEIRNIKQREFAEKIKTTEVTISRYINNTRQPKADMIVRICNTLGISSDWLLGMIDQD